MTADALSSKGYWNQTINPFKILNGPNILKLNCNMQLIITGIEPNNRNFEDLIFWLLDAR